MSSLPVLIVGAGPTGLTMACELARRGVPFRIIDKKDQPTLSSNATWIQARTLELFDLMGIVNRFLEIGNTCNAINFYLDGKSLAKLSFSDIPSTYPYTLMLAQSETEKILANTLSALNVTVERSLELVDVKQDGDTVLSTLRDKHGNTETIVSHWLVACDGANSVVREKCQINFPGEDMSEQFIVADAVIDSYMSKDEIHLFFDEGTTFCAFPMGANKYRITANLHLPYQRKIFTEREVIEMAQERAHGEYYVKSVSWISPFWIKGKVVNQMHHGSIFLAGDAAHIHSPAGGQGMNTGIQDAYNLAWKLALVIQNKAKPSLLDSYHEERHPIVKRIVEQTDYYTRMALFEDSFIAKLKKFVKQLQRKPSPISNKVGSELTQINIQYKDSAIIDYENVSGKSLLAGLRAPDVVIDSSRRLYDYFRDNQHHILLFAGLNPNNDKLTKLIELQKTLHTIYADLVVIHVVTREHIQESENNILDVNGIIHAQYQVKNAAVYIIRPDNYIAYCSKSLDPILIEDFLKRYL